MANNIVFSVSTEMEMEGRQLKAVKPNKDGIYTGIPLTVIGCNSRNNVSYEKQSVLKCLTDVTSRFAANVQSGDMEGEWGHPLLGDGDSNATLNRLLYIDRTRLSHYFTRIYGKDMGDGIIMIYGDVKPFGPYGQYLKDSFEDPRRNTSFSLRSAALKTGVADGIVQKKMISMVTFDAVDGPGFLKASKRFRDLDVATESLGIDLDPMRGYNVDLTVSKEEYLKTVRAMESAGMESIIENQAVLDAFNCDKVKIKEKYYSWDDKGNLVNADGTKPSLFGLMFGS